MKKRGMFFKQKMAALLALSMAVSSVPTGGLFTAAAAERENRGGAELIRFDREKLREKAEKAAQSKKMAAPPAVVASSSYALDFQTDSYELKDAGSLLAEGETLPEDTKLRIFLSPDEAGYEETEDGEIEYAMTGNESLVFMVENESDETRGYQLLFGNQITDVVTVKSKSQLLKEYETGFEEETATPSNAEETEAVKETLPAVTEETKAVKETLPAVPEETKAQPAESEETAAGALEETESVPETEPAESQEEEAQEPAEPQEAIEIETEDAPEEDHDSSVHLLGSLGRFLTGSMVAQAQELPATPSTARPETGAAEEAQDKPQETAGAAENATQETEAPASEAEDASPSDVVMEENPEAERYIRLDRAVISGSVLIYSRQEKVDAPEEIKPMMLMNMDRMETEQAKPKKSNTRAVALVTVPYQDIFAGFGQEDGTGDIRVNLYDYSGTGKDAGAVNRYLQEKLTSNRDIFGFGLGAKENARINSYYKQNGSVQNIYQGIPKAVGGQGKMDRHLFPEVQGEIDKKAVEVYPDVNTTDFFQYDPAESSYSYDSAENGVSFNEWSNRLSRESGSGFWPFGNSNWFFGMTMDFDFYKPADGMINGKPMVFSFSGDDDVWVYLKKQGSEERHLVLDIGGNHERMDGSINFATGEIIYSNQNAKPSDGDRARARSQDVIANLPGGENCVKEYDGDNAYGNSYSVYKTSIEEVCPKLGFTEGKAEVYTLEFYYLERGGQQSNCKLDFNLPVVPKQGIKISKQLAGTKLTEKIKNREYQFQIVSAESVDALKEYRAGDTQADVEISSQYTIRGAGNQSIKDAVEADQYFYIQEENPGTNTVFWDVSSSAPGTRPVEGTEAGNRDNYYYSAIYHMPKDEDSGFLFTCTNQFGELNPQIAKRAWLENPDDGTYDITLEVRGDEMEGTTSEGGNGAVDVVVAADNSQSLYFNINEVREAIKQLGMSLSDDSQLYLLEFASKPGTKGRDCPAYDSPKAKEYYYDTVFSWLRMDETGKAGLDEKLKDYKVASSNGDTHGAAGFVGAKFALEELGASSNKKVVIYLTDGKPDCYVSGGRLKKGDEGNRNAVEAVKTTFANLKNAYPTAEVYTIGFLDAAKDGGWLDPTNPDGIQVNKYYSAYDYDELLKAIGDISHEITSTTKVQNPVVTDTLSDAVELNDVQVGSVSYKIPELYVENGRVGSAADSKGTKLEVSIKNENIFSYRYPGSDNEIAQYDLTDRTITWYPGRTAEEASDEMGKDTVRTLTYRVKAVEPGEETSKYVGESDTGTHSGEEGYRSNVEAKLKYNGEDEKIFKHPVVIPVVAKADLIVVKHVAGYNGQEEYQFKIRFGNGEKLENPPVGAVWDNGSYKFELSDGGQLIFPQIPVGTVYEVEEYGADKINNGDYVLTQIKAGGTGTEEQVTSESRPTGLKTSGTIAENGSQAVFTNTYGAYGSIIVKKQVKGAPPENAQFSFSVKDNMTGETLEEFSLGINGEKEICIDPEKVEDSFTITETDTQGAWKTDSQREEAGARQDGNVITNVKSGQEVIVTNYYYDHIIELTKTVQGQEPNPDQEYQFTVKLATAEGSGLRQEDVKLVDMTTQMPITAENWGEETEDTNYSYHFTVNLTEGQTVAIGRLPQSVTGYEITENLDQVQVPGYNVEIQQVTVNGTPLENDGDYAVQVQYNQEDLNYQTDKIEFTNKYTAQIGGLQIEKTLTSGAASEDVSFVFKVTNEETGASFYVTVQVGQGFSKGTSSILSVPVGEYKVSEVSSSIYYKPYGESTKSQDVKPGETTIVEFVNTKAGGGYFTDVSSVVNTVDTDGFTPESDDDIQPMESALSKAGPFKKPDPVGDTDDGAEQAEE